MMIAKPKNQPHVAQDIEAMICWFSEASVLEPRKKYSLLHTTNEVKCLVTDVLYKVDVNTLHKKSGDPEVRLNDIARVKLRCSSPLLCDSYPKNRLTGSFILVDEMNHNTVAAGIIVERSS